MDTLISEVAGHQSEEIFDLRGKWLTIGLH